MCLVHAPLVPRHSWLGYAVWGCVFGLGIRLRSATPGWGVGVCVCVFERAPLVPCHSWLGCAVWMCVLGIWFRLRPATPGWGVGVCVCFCALSASSPPLPAGLVGVGVCAWARVPAAPRRSWLEWWGVCVCVCPRSACRPPLLAGVCGVGVCVWARGSAAPRHSWLGCWGVCMFMSMLRLYPATPGRGVRCGCVCLGSGFGCAPPLPAGLLGCVYVSVRAPLPPRHSWLGSSVWVVVLWLETRLRPATPGWRVWSRGMCLCTRSACTPALLAEECGVRVCVWARVLAVLCHSCLGCWGVCVCL